MSRMPPWAPKARQLFPHRFEEAHDDPAPAPRCWSCLRLRKAPIHRSTRPAPASWDYNARTAYAELRRLELLKGCAACGKLSGRFQSVKLDLAAGKFTFVVCSADCAYAMGGVTMQLVLMCNDPEDFPRPHEGLEDFP